MPHPPLPLAPARRADEPAAVYGHRLILWCLTGGLPAVLDDDQLALAMHAGAGASGCLPRAAARAADVLARVRRDLALTERRRRQAAALDSARGLLSRTPAPGQSGGRVEAGPHPGVNPGPAGGPSVAVQPASTAADAVRAADLAWARRRASVDVAF